MKPPDACLPLLKKIEWDNLPSCHTIFPLSNLTSKTKDHNIEVIDLSFKSA